MKKHIASFQAVAIMVGTIIGAGVLGIPYVFKESGFLTGFLILVFITFAMVSMKLMFGEITLRTKGEHQIPGYVGIYLGSFFKKITSFVMIVAITGSLIAYFVGIGEVLAQIFGGGEMFWSIIFYAFGSLAIFLGITLIKRVEFILTLIIFLVILFISFLSVKHLNPVDLLDFSIDKLIIPYGVILFACSGIVAIPEARKVLVGRELLLKKSILIGTILPSILYLFFALLVISVSGENTTEIATIGLGQVLGEKVIILANFFAFLTMSTSFLTMGLALRDAYFFDFKIKQKTAWFLTIAFPLIIYLFGFSDFIKILSLAGAIGFGINGFIYVLTYWRARKKGVREPEYKLSKIFVFPVSILLSVVFILGLIYTVIEML